MENHNFQWENPLYMAIFNSYVKLPEGNLDLLQNPNENIFPMDSPLLVHFHIEKVKTTKQNQAS